MNVQSLQYKQQNAKDGKIGAGCLSSPEKKLSLGSLITWNVAKVLEACPNIDLQNALQSTQERMERDWRDGAPMMSLLPDEQYLAGAVLAWHHLGHGRTDSLYEFIKSNLNEYNAVESVSSIKVVNRSVSKIRSCYTSSSSLDVKSIMGPVVRLPLETKIVMRVENSYQCRFNNNFPKSEQIKRDRNICGDKTKRIKDEVKNKVKAACMVFAIDKDHLSKLAELEEIISDLRTRVANISRRKVERMELLERTDMAWKDLELGYERRLKQAEDKAKDTEDQIKRILEERNRHKTKCKTLVEGLKKRSSEAEVMREKLSQLDKEVCGLACERLRLNELATKDDAALAAENCRLVQIDRDLEFKEQAERRKIQNLESEINTARGLAIEAERAIRSDFAHVQENLKQVTNEINKENNKNQLLKGEILELRNQKVVLACDLENCKMKFDKDMQQKIDLFNSKKKELSAIKERVIDCKCKLPMDASIEAKRTASLAASYIYETDGNPKSCSGASLQHQLMSDLLESLFDGLISDLCATGSLMPCQLLKCLDDSHDWERDNILKTNLLGYCTQLLIGELNIAISTTVENNHTRWISGCSAAKRNLKSRVDERDIDDRAKKLASEIAQQIFMQKADDLTRKTLKIVSSRMQPCHCNKECNKAIYPSLVKPPTIKKINESSNLKKTLKDVAQLREQIEILKKATIRKEDLKIMEDKLTKTLNRTLRSKSKSKNTKKYIISQTHNIINHDIPERDKDANLVSNRDNIIIMEEFDFFDEKKKFPMKPKHINKTPKKNFKNHGLPSTVVICISDTQKVLNNNKTKVFETSKKDEGNNLEISNIYVNKYNCANDSYLDDANNILLTEQSQTIFSKECDSNYEIPSNTSINKCIDSLTKTESDFQNPKMSVDIKKSNSKYSKFLSNEDSINLYKENQNFCSVKYDTCFKNLSSKESRDRNISAVQSMRRSCVCCYNENSNADDIEINALNLLKEHIKDKIKDLRPNVKYPITADEEKHIYEDILKEIKKFITNGTFEKLCECSFDNHEGSRQRAYNLLKEYLKIKIKKAQCSCTSKSDNSDQLLPTILDKITDLIENDFERLKMKYQEELINKQCSRELQNPEKE